MSILVPINGSNYIIPSPNEVGWGSNLDDFFVAIGAGTLQKTGGSFTLSAETDFGASYGLKSLYYKTRATDVASTGAFRLANAETGIVWRNFLGNGDLPLTVNASNQLTFNGTPIESNALTNAHILVGNSSNIATDVAMSGDISITNAGVTAIGSGKIVNAQVNASAAIAYSKLALTGSIVNADVSASAAIAYSKLNLALSVVNADISTSAAIAYSKLNLALSIVNADVSTSAAIAYSKLNLALSIVNADISTGAAIARSKIAVGTADHVVINDGSGNLSSEASLTVGRGGTGAGTHTAYAVLCGGTTTTAALQSIAGVGGSGQVLTSNGAGALPTFQDVAGTGTVNSGTAGRLTLYATSTNAVADTYVQNTKNITIAIAAQASRSANLALTIPNPGNAVTTGNFLIDSDTGSYTVAGAWTLSSALTISPATNQLVLGGTGGGRTVTINAPQPATSSRTYTMPDPGANASFMMTEGAQTVNGVQTFGAGLIGPAGVVGTPTLALGTSNLGFYRSAAGQIGFTTAGILRCTLDSNAFSNVNNVFRCAPTGSNTFPEYSSTSDTNSGLRLGGSDDLYLVTGATVGLTIDSAQAVAIPATLTVTGQAQLNGSTGNPIHGTNTNDSAAAGFVGEVISSSATAVSLPTSTQQGDLANVVLTAGDWMLSGLLTLSGATITATFISAGISTTSGNSTTGLTLGDNYMSASPSANPSSCTISGYHVKLSGSATYYLKMQATYVGGSQQFNGRITAVRIR